MQKLEWRYHRQCGHSIFGGEEEEGWPQGLGRCGQVPPVGETGQLHLLLPWRGRGRELGCGLMSCPALCPPCPSSAFLIHSGGSGLCFQHTSKGLQTGSSGTFLGNLFPGYFCLQKGRNRWEWKYMLLNWTSVSASVQARPGNGTLLEAPGRHIATWGGSSALGVMKPPPVATKAHMKPQKHRGGGF